MTNNGSMKMSYLRSKFKDEVLFARIMQDISTSDDDFHKEEIRLVKEFVETRRINQEDYQNLKQFSNDEVIEAISSSFLKGKENLIIKLIQADGKVAKSEESILRKCQNRMNDNKAY